MQVFITGATGFVGRNFLHWLIQNEPSAKITCLVRDPAKATAQWPQSLPQVRWLPGDLLQPETYADAVAQATVIVHAAALVSLRNGPEFYKMNTETTRQLLQAAQNSAHLQRLVFISSISAVDRPFHQPAIGPLTEESPYQPNTDYGRSKAQAEQLIQASQLPYTILRPAYIYGAYPRPQSSVDRLIQHIFNQQAYTCFPFPGRASAIYAEDLAEMIWLASQHPRTLRETFFVSDPQPASMRDVFSRIAQYLEVSHTIRSVQSHQIARTQQFLYHQAPQSLVLRILFEDFFYCSSEKWTHYTGHQPRYGYPAGLARTAAWYRENGLLRPIGANSPACNI